MFDEEEKKFIRLDHRDIDLGRPLRWAIYNGDRDVVRRQGDVIETQAEIERVFEKGAYRIVTMVDLSEGRQGESLRPGAGVIQVRAGKRVLPEGEKPEADEPESKAPAAGKKKEFTLESSKIRVGDPIQLQASPDQPRYVVRLIGYLKNRGLIVSQPELNGEVVMLRDGQGFVGRFFSGQNAFAFSTTVVRQTSVPYPHMHLIYPRDLRGVAVRGSSRLDVSIIASIEPGAGQPAMPGKIVNLSVNGAGLQTKLPLGEKGAVIGLKFKVSMLGVDSYLVLNAEICNVSQNPDEPAMPNLYGLKFVDVEHASQLSLMAFVYHKLQEEHGS